MYATSPQRTIRAYWAEDSTATLEIFSAAIMRIAAADYSPDQVQAWARPALWEASTWNIAMQKRNSFVATENNQIVGFSDVDETGYIDMMFVDPDHLRQGIAHSLLAEAERQARGFDAGSLHANVSITARPFFESQGFTIEYQQEQSLQGVTLVNYHMRKTLDAAAS